MSQRLDSIRFDPPLLFTLTSHQPHICRLEKAQAAREKLSEYQEKEKARMAGLLELAKKHRSQNALWKP